MIVRIVKMSFQAGKGEDFVQIFQQTKKKIRESRGCIFLELLRDKEEPDTFMTYSVWSSEGDLNRYRESELFKDTWTKVKAMFAKEPEARTMERMEKA